MVRLLRVKVLHITRQNAGQTARKLRLGTVSDPRMRQVAGQIVLDVRMHGDSALRRWSRRVEGVCPPRFAATRREIRVASSKVSRDALSALRFVADRVRARALHDLRSLRSSVVVQRGVRISRTFIPLRSVGCYVPGGSIAYPSSLVMSAVPARVTGVARVLVCSPPMADGRLNPLVAAASEICRVDEVYKLGGAQAIAAMAYGTPSIDPVDKIVGPGGPYVLAAKQIVSNDVGIDMPAGPTELLVVSFGKFNQEFVARDLIAQAEHSPSSICGVVTDSLSNAKKIVSALSKFLQESQNVNARKALERSLFICTAKSLDDVATFVNTFAPEHVQLLGDAVKISKDIRTCGLLLVGDYSPSAASDYSVGSNHILPTGGLASSYSGLSVLDFLRRMETVTCTRKGLCSVARPAVSLARAEGLDNHARAILERLDH